MAHHVATRALTVLLRTRGFPVPQSLRNQPAIRPAQGPRRRVPVDGPTRHCRAGRGEPPFGEVVGHPEVPRPGSHFLLTRLGAPSQLHPYHWSSTNPGRQGAVVFSHRHRSEEHTTE